MKQVSEDTRGVEGRRPSPENEEDQRQKSPHVFRNRRQAQTGILKMVFEPIYSILLVESSFPPVPLSCVGTMSVAAFNQNAAAAVRDYQVNPRLGTIHVNLSSSLPRRPLARPRLAILLCLPLADDLGSLILSALTPPHHHAHTPLHPRLPHDYGCERASGDFGERQGS